MADAGMQDIANDLNEIDSQEQYVEEQPGPDDVEAQSQTIEPEVTREYVEPPLLLSNARTAYEPGFTEHADLSEKPSLLGAVIRESTSVGALLNYRDPRTIADVDYNKFNPLDYVEDDMLPYIDQFALDTTPEQVRETDAILRREFADEAVIAESPLGSFSLGMGVQLIDPVNWLPGGAIFKAYKVGSRTLKAAVTSGSLGLGSSVLQESALQSSQLTRSIEESAYNVVASTLLGAALGGGAGGMGARVRYNAIKRQRAQRDIITAITGEDVPTSANGLITNADIETMPEFVQKGMFLTPMNRLITSTFDTAKRFASLFYEHNYNLVKNQTGDSFGVSAESSLKLFKSKMSSAFAEYQQTYFTGLGIESGPFKGTRSKMKNPELSYEQWDREVSYSLTTDTLSSNDSVNHGAKVLREKVYDPIHKKLVELGKIEPDVTPANAAKYFMVVYNKQKILEAGGPRARGAGTFPQFLFDGHKNAMQEAELLKQSPEYISFTQRKDLLAKLYNTAKEKLGKQPKVKDINAQIKELKRQHELALPKKRAGLMKKIRELEAKKAERKEASKIVKGLKDDIGEHNKTLGDIARPELINDSNELISFAPDDVIWKRVDAEADSIMGQKDGMLLNPMVQKIQGLGVAPLKARKILIDQASARDWHNQSAQNVSELYIRAMAPFISLETKAREYGFKSFDDMRLSIEKNMKDEYHAKLEGLTGKAADKVEKEFKANMADMNASIELIQGVYGAGPNVLNDGYANLYDNILKYNYTRLLGGMAISSLVDVGMHIFRNGFGNAAIHGLGPMLTGLKSQSKSDLNIIGYAMETLMGSRLKSFLDSDTLSTNPGAFTRGLDKFTQGFGNFVLMNQWNDAGHLVAGTTSIHRTLSTIAKVVEGQKVSQKEIKRLAQLGLRQESFAYIYSQTKGNIHAKSGTRFADWGNWKIDTPAQAKALEDFQAVTSKDIDATIIKPGLGDKPLFSRQKVGNFPIGKFVLQFKSHMFAATNKILLTGVQRRRDAEVWSGLTSLMTMGAITYGISQTIRGKEIDMSPENLIKEAIDRSGVLGIYMEVFNTAQRAGFLPGDPVSRYRSRGAMDALLGPTFGTMIDFVTGMGKVTKAAFGEDELTAKDLQAFVRLAPTQNAIYFQGLVNTFVGKTAEAFNLEDNRPESNDG